MLTQEDNIAREENKVQNQSLECSRILCKGILYSKKLKGHKEKLEGYEVLSLKRGNYINCVAFDRNEKL